MRGDEQARRKVFGEAAEDLAKHRAASCRAADDDDVAVSQFPPFAAEANGRRLLFLQP